MTHSPKTMLRALDPNLPFLAAEVAVDVDNLLAGRSANRDAMISLAKKLMESAESEPTGDLRSKLDVATLTVLGEAVSANVNFESSSNKVQDLLVKAKEIADTLENGDPNANRDQLEQAGEFCVALSRAAAGYSESIRDLRPSHPFRR